MIPFSSEVCCSNFLIVSTSTFSLVPSSALVSLSSLERNSDSHVASSHHTSSSIAPIIPPPVWTSPSLCPPLMPVFSTLNLSVFFSFSFPHLSLLSLILPLSLRSLLPLSVTAPLCVYGLKFDAWMDMEFKNGTVLRLFGFGVCTYASMCPSWFFSDWYNEWQVLQHMHTQRHMQYMQKSMWDNPPTQHPTSSVNDWQLSVVYVCICVCIHASSNTQRVAASSIWHSGHWQLAL